MNREWQVYDYDVDIKYQYGLSRIKNEEGSLVLLFTNAKNRLVHPIDQKTVVVAEFPGQPEEVKVLKTLKVAPNYVKGNNKLGWIFEIHETARLKRYVFFTDRDIVEVVSSTPPLVRKEKR